MTEFLRDGLIFAIAGTTFAVAIAIIYLYSIRLKRRKRDKVPTHWMPVGKVKSLIIYPLKSGGGKPLENAVCTKFGLIEKKSNNMFQLRDRNLIIFKEDIKQSYFHSKILLIETHANDETHIILKAPGMDQITVKIPQTNCDNVDTIILSFCNEELNTTDCGDEVAKWLSQYILGQDWGLRMGYSEGQKRENIPEFLKYSLKFYPKLLNDKKGIYSYTSSYHLLSQASVDDLNNRMVENVTAQNFRPNVLVEGVDAFAEDHWAWIKIGDVIFYHVINVPRCFITNYNPKNAEKHLNYEPINTLRTYRIDKGKPYKVFHGAPIMGVHLGMLNDEGPISVGDTVYVGKITSTTEGYMRHLEILIKSKFRYIIQNYFK